MAQQARITVTSSGPLTDPSFPARLRANLKLALAQMLAEVQAEVEQNLSGGMLHQISGKFRRSVRTRVTETQRGLRGTVSVGGRRFPQTFVLHFGGRIKDPEERPTTKHAMHWIGPGGEQFAGHVQPHSIRIPARPYLLPAFQARVQDLAEQLGAAAQRTFQDAGNAAGPG
jgi:hypothetical protein